MRQRFFGLWLFMLASVLQAANPTFQDFNTNQFSTNGLKLNIKSGVGVTNLNVKGDPVPFVVNTNQLVVTNGNVGIGITIPPERLSVSNGNFAVITRNNSFAGYRIYEVGDERFNLQYLGRSLGLAGRSGNLELETTSWVNLDLRVGTTSRLYINSTNGVVTLGGMATTFSNKLAPTSITFPATTVPWTNTFAFNIQVYIDNFGITGTVLKKNGVQIAGGLTQFMSFGLQPGEYFSQTFSVGTPTATFSPF